MTNYIILTGEDKPTFEKFKKATEIWYRKLSTNQSTVQKTPIDMFDRDNFTESELGQNAGI
jgi:hypothetical protein